MFQRLLIAAHGPCAALFVVFAILGFAPQAFAENPDPKAAEKRFLLRLMSRDSSIVNGISQ